jgi:drug/metabolite transporter (DMT)-like permease
MSARSATLRAVLYIVLATICFAWLNAEVKVLRPHLPIVELIWVRSLGHVLFMVALFAPRRGWRLLYTRRPAIHLARSIVLLASTSFFFTAIGLVPLADATAVSFTTPFIVAALAGKMLRERVEIDHWIAIAVGFVGALIIVRPGATGTSPYVLLVLGSATCYALYQLLTRKVADTDAPETSVTYSALVGTLILTLIVPVSWRTPASTLHWAIILSLGLLGGLGDYFVARALTIGRASLVAPFQYVQLVWAATIGYLMFGDVPSAWTWVGAVIVIARGLYIAWQGTRPVGFEARR